MIYPEIINFQQSLERLSFLQTMTFEHFPWGRTRKGTGVRGHDAQNKYLGGTIESSELWTACIKLSLGLPFTILHESLKLISQIISSLSFLPRVLVSYLGAEDTILQDWNLKIVPENWLLKINSDKLNGWAKLYQMVILGHRIGIRKDHAHHHDGSQYRLRNWYAVQSTLLSSVDLALCKVRDTYDCPCLIGICEAKEPA